LADTSLDEGFLSDMSGQFPPSIAQACEAVMHVLRCCCVDISSNGFGNQTLFFPPFLLPTGGWREKMRERRKMKEKKKEAVSIGRLYSSSKKCQTEW
jgi:hypothetical protein